ncbi:uncharacterized protein K452DRAFT_301428 [Aplosporella prunicola CBS 121167]|uniref:Uncharacterized protein n=1 Tax=Aplosporella prunicola CBS 121167 TaxID=1176127 RepID=A0A6A6B3V6_9PEZI|nr:uncharacterized protein K452DRAFT_301428 [Aplosporella prunicola CBS 121167]KAF2138053.1 hypothetical protein K452DRAFT_301428 [Aplosporella prunicola CBS 121167]
MCVVEKRIYLFSGGEREVYEHVKNYCDRAMGNQPCSSVRFDERVLQGAGHSARSPRVRLVPDTGASVSPLSESFPSTPTNEPSLIERRPSKSSRNYGPRTINPTDINFRLGGGSNRKGKEAHRGHRRHASSGASTLSEQSLDTTHIVNDHSPLSSTFAEAGHSYRPPDSHAHASSRTATMAPPRHPATAPASAPPSGPPRPPVAVATGFPDDDPNRKRKAKDLRPIITGPTQGVHHQGPTPSTPNYAAEVRTPRDVPHPAPARAQPVEDAMSALDLNDDEPADAIYARKEAARYEERERLRKQQREDQWHADYERMRANAREEARRNGKETRRREEEARLQAEEAARHREDEGRRQQEERRLQAEEVARRRQQEETRQREEEAARRRDAEARRQEEEAARRQAAAAAQRRADDDWETKFEAGRRAAQDAARLRTEPTPAPAPAPREEPTHTPRPHQKSSAATSRPRDKPSTAPFRQQHPEPIREYAEPVRHRRREEPSSSFSPTSPLHSRTNARPTPSLHNAPARDTTARSAATAEVAEREALNRRELEQLARERRSADARDVAAAVGGRESLEYERGGGATHALGSGGGDRRGSVARRAGDRPVVHQAPLVGGVGAASARGRDVVERERQRVRDERERERERGAWYSSWGR